MGYAEELVRLLRPLGVYSFREGSFSLGELQALGGALDAAQARLSRMQRESIPATAEDEGLDRMEALGGDGKAGACAGVVSEADGRPGRLCADARHH